MRLGLKKKQILELQQILSEDLGCLVGSSFFLNAILKAPGIKQHLDM